jgi:hypothetical protein
MRASFKLLGAAIVASLAFGTGVAQADVFVTAHADKNKTVTVNKTITITKTVTVEADTDIDNDGVSEQDIFANQRNQFNYYEEEAGSATNNILNSHTGASGEQATIQNNGSNNNNLNSDSLSYANSESGITADSEGVFSDAEVNVEQINGLTEEPPQPNGPTVVPPDQDPRGVNVFLVGLLGGAVTYTNNISGSFNQAAGVAKTIQENGSNNNNFNGVAIALGDKTTFALDEVNAGQFNNFNFADVANFTRSNNIDNSFVGYNGITATIQNNGGNSNNANSSAISASLLLAPAPGARPVGNFGGVTP